MKHTQWITMHQRVLAIGHQITSPTKSPSTSRAMARILEKVAVANAKTVRRWEIPMALSSNLFRKWG